MKFLISFLSIIGITFGATYYVSPTGSNSNPGTYDRPWATPGYGSKHISSGDTLIILSGTYILSVYYDDMVTPPSGTPSAWTVIKGSGSTRPKLLGTNNLLAAVEITNQSYIKISNLELASLIDTPYSNGMREGIEAGGSGGPTAHVDHIIVDSVLIHYVEESGINFAGDIDSVILSNSEIKYTGMAAISSPDGSGNGWQNVTIHDTYIGYAGHFYQGQITPSPWDRPDGIGVEEGEGPVEVYNVTCEHNRGDGIDLKVKRSYVHNTIIANNFADGLKFWGDSSRAVNVLIYGTGDGDSTSTPWSLIVIETSDTNAYFELINVTAHDDSSRGHYCIGVQYGINIPITVLMRNTIVSGSRRAYFETSVNLIADHNLFHVMDENVQIYANGVEYTDANLSSLGPGNIYGDPKFVDPEWGTTGDFHLQSTSPAIDSGTSNLAPNTDLEYYQRPYGNGYDIGAYEYHQGSTGINEMNKPEHNFATILRGGYTVKINYPAKLFIFDLSGRLRWHAVRQNKSIVKFPDLPTGLYIIELKRENKPVERMSVILLK